MNLQKMSKAALRQEIRELLFKLIEANSDAFQWREKFNEAKKMAQKFEEEAEYWKGYAEGLQYRLGIHAMPAGPERPRTGNVVRLFPR